MRNGFKAKLPPDGLIGAFIALCGISLVIAAVWYAVSGLVQYGLMGLLLNSEGCILMLAFAGLLLWAGGSQAIPAVRQILGQKRAYENGKKIYAVYERTDDVDFKVGKKHLQAAVFTCADEFGWQREYFSHPMKSVPAERLRGEHIPVYIDPENPENYYVDLQSVLN